MGKLQIFSVLLLPGFPTGFPAVLQAPVTSLPMSAALTALFWFGFAVLFYAYLGYGLLVRLLLQFKKKGYAAQEPTAAVLPAVTFVVCAYNEAD